MNAVELVETLLADLSEELNSEPTFNEVALKKKIESAIKEVKRIRSYPSTYTDSQVESDLENYYSSIRNIALYDYNLIGAEGESNHNENGVNRAFVDRKSLFHGIMPIAKF